MTSDICVLSKDNESLNALLSETTKAASYAKLSKKEALRLRLLSEELVCMLPELLDYSDGKFWIESDNKKFEIHVSLSPNSSLTMDKRENLIALSSDGKNAAAKGILTKIKLAAQFMLIDYEYVSTVSSGFYSFGFDNGISIDTSLWSLNNYKNKVEKANEEEWDELEKSIIAQLADDVLVGVQEKKVEIIVKKAF